MWSPVIQFGEWLPDRQRLSGPDLRDAKNVIPHSEGRYSVLSGLSSANRGALDTFCRGAASGRAGRGTDFVVAGTSAKLWLAQASGQLVDETRLAGPYTSLSRWDFALSGDDLIATNYDDGPQRYIFGTSAEFALLNANAPKARHCAMVREFLVLANLVGQGTHVAIYGTREDAVHWGGQGLPGSWETTGTSAAKAVRSDWQPLVDGGGQVTDLVGGADYGMVFKERSVWRMDYSGGDDFFGFAQIDGSHGSIVHGSAIRVGERVFFLSETGVRMITGGGPSVPIGAGRVDNWFLSTINLFREERFTPFLHPKLPVIGWSFMSKSATGDLLDTILFYNYFTDRFSRAEVSIEWMVEAIQSVGSLDLAPLATTVMDTPTMDTTVLDSLGAGGIKREMAAFRPDHTIGLFAESVSEIASVIELGDIELTPGQSSFVSALRVLYGDSGSSLSGSVLARDRISDAQTETAFSPENASGEFTGRAAGRYCASRFTFYGAFTNMHGVQAHAVADGER